MKDANENLNVEKRKIKAILRTQGTLIDEYRDSLFNTADLCLFTVQKPGLGTNIYSIFLDLQKQETIR